MQLLVTKRNICNIRIINYLSISGRRYHLPKIADFSLKNKVRVNKILIHSSILVDLFWILNLYIMNTKGPSTLSMLVALNESNTRERIGIHCFYIRPTYGRMSVSNHFNDLFIALSCAAYSIFVSIIPNN